MGFPPESTAPCSRCFNMNAFCVSVNSDAFPYPTQESSAESSSFNCSSFRREHINTLRTFVMNEGVAGASAAKNSVLPHEPVGLMEIPNRFDAL
jgi:hypothetical protein